MAYSDSTVSGRAHQLSGSREFPYNLVVRRAPGRATVLVVEDDADLRTLYRVTLMSAGYMVVAVEDGVEALRHIEADIPDAVILDMALPRLGGRDVQRELKAHASTRDIPIIVASGTDTRGFTPADVAFVLRKPIALDTLLVAVDTCLRKAPRRRQAEPA